MQLSVYLLGERFALLCGAHQLLMCPLNPLSILLVPWSWAFSFCDLFTSIWFQSHPSAFLTASWGWIVRVDSWTKLAHTYIPRVWDVWSTKQGGHDVPFKEEQKLTGNSPCLASWNGMHHLSHLLSHSFVMNFLRAIVTRSYHASHYSFRVALCIETSKKIPIWLLSSSVPNKTTTKSTCKEIPGCHSFTPSDKVYSHSNWLAAVSVATMFYATQRAQKLACKKTPCWFSHPLYPTTKSTC